MEFKSTGMMQEAELAAEASALQLEYEANLAGVREAEAKGEVGQMGAGLSPEEIWGEGPWGCRSPVERIRSALQGGSCAPDLKVSYRQNLLEAGYSEEEIDRELPELR